MHACIHAYMHTCIHAYMHTCIHAYMHTCIHAYTHTCIHAYRHTDIQTYRHTDIQTYRHTHTHLQQYGPGRVEPAEGGGKGGGGGGGLSCEWFPSARNLRSDRSLPLPRDCPQYIPKGKPTPASKLAFVTTLEDGKTSILPWRYFSWASEMECSSAQTLAAARTSSSRSRRLIIKLGTAGPACSPSLSWMRAVCRSVCSCGVMVGEITCLLKSNHNVSIATDSIDSADICGLRWLALLIKNALPR